MSNNSLPINNINAVVAAGRSQARRSEVRDVRQETDRARRITHSIEFKLEVCDYMKNIPNATRSGCSRFFNIQRKQVNYFLKHENAYRALPHPRIRRNIIGQIKLRAKYFAQEQIVFAFVLESRRNGKKNLMSRNIKV